MPASVAAATSVGVLPWTTIRSFQEKRTLATDQNRYPDARQQTRIIASSSRKEFSISARLTATELDDLITFYVTTCSNGTESFYFYNVWETVPKYSYDDTGVAITGRYVVRFNGPLQYSLDWGRNPVQFSLIEVS